MDVAKFQKDCCANYGVEYLPPGPDQLVLVSAGIYDPNFPVNGTRNAADDQFSGWQLTTDKYDGKHASLFSLHFYHLQEQRPDLAVYMALPVGASFLLGSTQDHVSFSEEGPLPEHA